MSSISKVIITLCFFLNLSALAFTSDYKLSFNTDVVVCPNGVFSLTLTEQKALFPGQPLNLFSPNRDKDFIQKNLKDLFTHSPQRALFIADMINNKIPLINYQANIQLNRHSPISALIIPKECQIEPLALSQISLVPESFASYINKDLFLKMSPQDQFLSLMELGLDIEQGINGLWKTYENWLSYSEIPFDVVQSRDFLRCWYSSTCRPKNISTPQTYQLFKKFKLSYIEQSGILIPTSSKYGTYPNGLVSYTNKTFQAFPSLAKYFTSKIKINGTVFDFTNFDGFESDLIPGINFATNGNIQCLPINNKNTQLKESVIGTFNNQKHLFIMSSIFTDYFPVCFNRQGQITQGFIPFQSLIEIPFQNKFITGSLTKGDDYERSSFGAFVRIYPSGAAHLLFSFKGTGTIQNKKIPINGPVILRPDGSIECAQFSKAAVFQTDKLQNYEHDPLTENILCFNEKNLLVKVLSTYGLLNLIEEELPPY